MPIHNRKTCKRYDILGDVHFLTFSCFRRLPLLNKDRSRQWFLDAIELCQKKKSFDLWAYVIMPEHVHLVIFPTNETKISSILTTIKQSVSKRSILWLEENAPDFLNSIEDVQPNGKRSYRFWQRGGGYDRNLRSVRDIHEKIRYVHENPVRRGLCQKTSDWQWSSALSWETGCDEPVTIDRQSLPPLTILDDDISSSLLN